MGKMLTNGWKGIRSGVGRTSSPSAGLSVDRWLSLTIFPLSRPKIWDQPVGRSGNLELADRTPLRKTALSRPMIEAWGCHNEITVAENSNTLSEVTAFCLAFVESEKTKPSSMIPNRGGARQSTVDRHYFAQLLPSRLAARLNGYEFRGRARDDADVGARPLRPQAFDLLGISGGVRDAAFRRGCLPGRLQCSSPQVQSPFFVPCSGTTETPYEA
jgi:hypothetical protein